MKIARCFIWGLLCCVSLVGRGESSIPAGRPTAEEISLANALIQEHLPAVKHLVGVLEQRAPKEYHKAIRDLAKSKRRLDGMKKRDQQLHDFDVQLLQAQVRVDLLGAQLQVTNQKSLEQELRQAIDDRAKLKIARLQRQRVLLGERVQQSQQNLDALEQQVLKLQEKFSEQTQREFEQILRRAGQTRQRTTIEET